MSKKYCGYCALLVVSIFDSPVNAATSAKVREWGAVMGQSGLRRFYSTGSDLGELVNRQLSYRLANRTSQATSDVDGYLLQWDSLVPVATAHGRPFLIRGLARTAKRVEPDKLHSRNDRLDLGVLYAPTSRSYIGLGLAYEHTDAEIKFVDGITTGNALGPRFDAGMALTNTLALGVRLEELRFDGHSSVVIQTPQGAQEFGNPDRHCQSTLPFFAVLGNTGS